LLLKNSSLNFGIHPSSSGNTEIVKYGGLIAEYYKRKAADNLIADSYIPKSYLPSNIFMSHIVPPYV
jgi:hypothetical protein